jgi:hypothetical protein
MELGSALGKQHILRDIAVAQEEKQPTFDVEYNVYQLIIRYEERQVELWDTMMHYDEEQEPYTMTLEEFFAGLNAYVPPR